MSYDEPIEVLMLTTNEAKFERFRKAFERYGIKLVRPQHIEAVEENGSDVIENAKLKVKPYVGYPYIVMAVDEAFYTDNTEKTPSADKKVTPEEESRKNQSG